MKPNTQPSSADEQPNRVIPIKCSGFSFNNFFIILIKEKIIRNNYSKKTCNNSENQFLCFIHNIKYNDSKNT